MDVALLFNCKNLLFWVILIQVILVENILIGRSPLFGRSPWSEQRRFWVGLATLFGGALLMVFLNDWSLMTWAVLFVLVAAAWAFRLDLRLTGNLWLRREGHRWTLVYFLSFLVAVPLISLVGLNLVTWGAAFFSLGLCGATKLAWEGFRDSTQSAELRQAAPLPPDNPRPGGSKPLRQLKTTSRENNNVRRWDDAV